MFLRPIETLAMMCALLAGGTFAQGFLPRTADFADSRARPGFSVISQSQQGVELVYSVPRVIFTDRMVGGRRMTAVGLPGALLGNDEGAPDLPGVSRFIAVPRGARFAVEVVESRRRLFTGIDLPPATLACCDNDDRPPQYSRDPSIYGADAAYPAQPVIASEPMIMRGVDCFVLGVTPFAYNPIQRELVVYTDIRVRVAFQGGTGGFGDDDYRSRWFEPLLSQHLLNYASLQPIDFATRSVPSEAIDECEYMIFVPNDPVFEAWAGKIEDFRVKQGVTTNIFNIAGLGGTAAGIEAKIDEAYDTWTTKPVAVLLVGDVPAMPAPVWNGYCLSDNVYADIDGDDLPELNVARITARDGNELGTMVNKFIDYENDPPTSSGFYDQPVVAGGWQDGSWFILACEVVQGYFAGVLGKLPVREYAICSGTPGSTWSTAPGTSMVVDYFGPNGLGYIPATPAHLTDWGGNATRLNNDLNNGAFWLLHRDHGTPTGWGHPAYSIADLAGLANSELPFVLSIDCSTGRYNYNPECFAEAFHCMQHGALGVIAASNISYSFVTDTYLWGVHDSLWPDFDPGYGGGSGQSRNVLMPGFANLSGKYYLHVSSWPYNPSSKEVIHHIFHLFGDAFTQICSEVPAVLTVSHGGSLSDMATSFDVTAPAGALIALSADGRLLGTAAGNGGVTTMLIDPPRNPGGFVYVTATKPNHARYEGPVAVLPGGPLAIWPSSGTPESMLPGPEVDVEVTILAGQQSYVPGSGKVHYRFGPNDPFAESPLTDLGGDLYLAVIPGARPESLPEFYLSARGNLGSIVYSPGNAPQSAFSYTVEGLPEVILHDSFETGLGWTVENTSLVTGAWERCTPNPTSGQQVAPLSDNPQGFGTKCYVTDNGPPNAFCEDYDVDGGPTRLISPVIDLSAGDAMISAHLWFYGPDGDDPFEIEVSNDNGVNWTAVYSTRLSLDGWTYHAFDVADYVTPTSQVKVRFSVQDQPNNSITEAGVDDVMVVRINADSSIWAGAYTISAPQGCSIPLYIDAGSAYAGRQYVVGGSMSGSYPGYALPGGKVIPLNYDGFTAMVLSHLNAPQFQDFLGNLDGAGEAVAMLDSFGPVNPLYVGRRLTFAFTLTGAFDFVSTPVQIVIEP